LIPGNPGALFPNFTGQAAGILLCLLESQYSVDLLGESSLQPDMSRFPLIVIPECETISSIFRDDLLEYVRQGGSLLVIGDAMSSLFSEASGINLKGGEWLTASIGSGKIGFIPTGISDEYVSGSDAAGIRSNMKAIVNELFPEPMAEVESSPYVDVSLRKHNGKTQLHLVNTSGDHRFTAILDSIEPVKDIKVTVRLPEKPHDIIRQPDGERLKFKYKDGKATLKLDHLEIYDIIEID